MLKELLISFLVCLVIGAIFNGMNTPSPVPTTPTETLQPAPSQNGEPSVSGSTNSGQAGSGTEENNIGNTEESGSSTSSSLKTAEAAQETGDANFEHDVLNSRVPVLVDFSATWCAPCQRMSPIIDRLASEYHGKVKVFKVDTDRNPGLSQKYQVDALPTFMVFRDGHAVSQYTGAMPRELLVGAIDRQLGVTTAQ